MREHGVTEAEWTPGHDGCLVHCKLGAPPTTPGMDLQLTEEDEKRAKEARDRLLDYLTYGASS